ncbi:MAG: hypothetical protein WA751_10635 [Candidatus Dormiibacterota bacterium]
MGIVELVILVVVVAGIVIALFGWDRYRGGRSSVASGSTAERTDEVFIDPDSGQRMRVWYDPKTGQREYRPE